MPSMTQAQKKQAEKELVLAKTAIERDQQAIAELALFQKEQTIRSHEEEEAEEDEDVKIERAIRYNEQVDAAQIEAQAAALKDNEAPNIFIESLKESSLKQKAAKEAAESSYFDFANNTVIIKSSRTYKKPKNTAQARTFASGYQNAFATSASTPRFPSADASSSRVEALPTAVASWVQAPPMAVASRVDESPTALSSPSVVRAAHTSQTLSTPVSETLQAQIAHKKISLDPQATSVEVDENVTTIKLANGASVTHQADPEDSDKSIYKVTHQPGLSEETQVINSGVILANMYAAEHTNQNKPGKSLYAVAAHLAGFFTGEDVAASYSAEDTQAIATAWKLADSHGDKFTVSAGEHVIDKASMAQASVLENMVKLKLTPTVELTDKSTVLPPVSESTTVTPTPDISSAAKPTHAAPAVSLDSTKVAHPSTQVGNVAEPVAPVVTQSTGLSHAAPAVSLDSTKVAHPKVEVSLSSTQVSNAAESGAPAVTNANTQTSAPVVAPPQSPVVTAAIAKHHVEVSAAPTTPTTDDSSPKMKSP